MRSRDALRLVISFKLGDLLQWLHLARVPGVGPLLRRIAGTPPRRDKCPMCGSKSRSVHEEFLRCNGCGELLHPWELVPRATNRTRAAYKANNHGAQEN